ncbi:MAG: sulfotransferase [Novosphingobium sp. 32-60-15]|uniref:sulfotransferase family protein n=1 Tax=unclassified Novosphingobium TaxID=2644732 RepID=UPI000BDCDEF6|nr:MULTISPECIES: sulfotransferase [unclassified Novosphingobium]OYX64756.1 MAG: sulfotransferase [Novosphingobium sp. 32-60-15]
MNQQTPPTVQPAFIVIGAVKAATTWIQKQLQGHPAVFLPDVEPHYFSSEYERGPAYYDDLFRSAAPGALLGEKSADYLAHPLAAERIARTYPDIKLMVQFRNPVDRAYSDYKMLFRRGTIRGAPEAYLTSPDCEQPRFLRDGLYAEHLARWFDLFPRENILPFLYEDVRDRPDATFRKVCQHIGVEPRPTIAAARRENDSSERFLPLPVRKVLSPLKSAVAPLRNQRWFQATRGMMARQIAYPPLAPALRHHLEQFYQDDVAQLEAMLGWDLSHWRKTQFIKATA